VDKKKLFEDLKGFLKDFDLPLHRKENDTPQNFEWLKKNLAVRNSGHINFDSAMGLILKLLK
jgi:hypothetical protein